MVNLRMVGEVDNMQLRFVGSVCGLGLWIRVLAGQCVLYSWGREGMFLSELKTIIAKTEDDVVESIAVDSDLDYSNTLISRERKTLWTLNLKVLSFSLPSKESAMNLADSVEI
ncbi:hypothetical protein LOAG_01670 [Loa loa]|uniref:Uncharacterized protein n=1 Tax=Loa loa TaxID=7209 RepID=A0A1S0U882_LOALO|nr:hypothetical protein LOAG_01670 [Loa loa]EFO26816.1 hypothetical protein LOAG_01670 [Loa loa]